MQRKLTCKKCPCGCTDFLCASLTRARTLVDETRGWSEDDYTEEFAAVGPYECAECGANYPHWDDIPDAPGAPDTGKTRFDAVFVGASGCLQMSDIVCMVHLLDTAEVVPLEIRDSRHIVVAIGLISKEAADELGQQYQALLQEVRKLTYNNVSYEGSYLIHGQKVFLANGLSNSFKRFGF